MLIIVSIITISFRLLQHWDVFTYLW